MFGLTLGFANLRRTSSPKPRRTFRPSIDVLEDRRLLAVRLVDDDLVQFPSASYTSIQAAVDAANPGDIIRVAPGTYEEEVVVDKRLTIQGAKASLAQAEDPTLASIVDPPNDGVAGDPSIGFNVQANDVVIERFTIGELDGVADPDGSIGVQTQNNISGFKIQRNVIENNTFGIYLNSSTANNAKASFVSANVIRDNNAPGAASGNGIYSDQGASRVTIIGNTITGHDNTAIIFVPLDASGNPVAINTRISIVGNTIRDSEILLTATQKSTVMANRIVDSNTNGIELGGATSDLVIQANVISNPAWTGINVTGALASTPDADNRIWANVITGAGDSGIRLRNGSSGNWVRLNVVSGSEGDPMFGPGFGNGISLEDSDDNRIDNNFLTGNNKDGLFVDADSSGNVIQSNFARNNDEHDYHDDSTGALTAGTANTYRNNRGRTESRPGLIRFFV